MPATYKDFYREPSKPHQCMHHSEKDGTRCRASAMHNHFMCYHHHDDDIPTVIQNDIFLIEALDTHAGVQKALTDVAARLACNHIDLKRAGLLLQAIQIAATTLRTQTPAPPAHTPGTPGSKVPSSTLGLSPTTTPSCPAVSATERPKATPPPRLHGWKVPTPALNATQPKLNAAQPTPPSTPHHQQLATNNQQPATKNRLPRCQRNRRRCPTH